MHLQNGCGEDQYEKENTSVVGLYVWSRTLHLLEGASRQQVGGGKESCCGCSSSLVDVW